MDHGHAGTRRSKPRDYLQDAAWIRAHNDIRPRSNDRRDLLALQLPRDLGLREVVDPGATAAAFGIGDLGDRDALDRTQQRARLHPDALTMREVAGVLVHDTQRTRGAVRPRPRDLRHIAHARAEGAAALGPGGILLKYVAVGFQVRAAARRVHDDRKVVTGERVDVQSGELPRVLAVTGVRVQRAAAQLLDRDGDTVTVALEDSHGRSLGITERLTHHAPGEHAHVGVRPFRERERRTFGAWSEGAEPREAARPDAPRQRSQPAAHDEVGEPGHNGQSPWARDGIETDPPHRPFDRTHGVPLGQHLSSAFHDPAERNA